MTHMTWPSRLGAAALALSLSSGLALAQDASVNPGINDSYKDPNPSEAVERFETESREVFAHRHKIVDAAGAKPGMTVADIGAGTGLFTRLLADAVGDDGSVYAVDIATNFLQHIEKTAKAKGIGNIETILATAESANLPADSTDLAFICDTYHHFEFPQKTMASIHRALKPGGRVVVIDFHRIEGVSSDWILKHVRAGQDVFRREIESAGFRLIAEPKFLKENYFMIFTKVEPPKASGSNTAADQHD